MPRTSNAVKLRADSTFARLAPAELAEVEDMLLGGASYADVQVLLADYGQKCSQTAIAKYYHSRIIPRKWAAQQKVAADLATLGSEGVDEATLNAVRQATLELALTPGTDPKSLRTLFDLVLKAQAQRMDERKLKLLEQRAAAADEAKAALERKVAAGGLTPEALALAEEQLNLL